MDPVLPVKSPTQCDGVALIAGYDVLDLSVMPLSASAQHQKLYLHSTSLDVLCEKEAVRYHTDYR